MLILIVRHICLVFISPLSELKSIVCSMVAIDRLCFATKLDDMKECEAPESNKSAVRCELARNIPSTTS
jgi:hypothetical protein